MTEKWIIFGFVCGLAIACLSLLVAAVVALCKRQWQKAGIRFGIAVTSFVLAAAILPAMATARPQRNRCMSNLSQLGKAMKMYSMDHDRRCPPSFLALTNYANNARLFICPHSKHTAGMIDTVDTWSDYVLVTNLSEDSNQGLILAYCKPGNHRDSEGINALFVDGAVQWISESDFGTLTCDVLKGSRINNREPQQRRP